jgi:glutathione reductase (NADPH)
MTTHFDLICIGGGSGGIACARRAASYGASVAVIEYGPLGGTCVNVGCVPKKVMWQASGIAATIEQAADFGFDVKRRGFDWSRLKRGRDHYVARLNQIYGDNLAGSGVVHIEGRAVLDGPDRVLVGGELYTADRIVVAVGGGPVSPDIQGADLGITSDGFFELETLPERVAVVGSGYIACELSGVLHGLGSETVQMVRRDAILREFDPMIQQGLMEAMERHGMSLRTGVVPAEVSAGDDGLMLRDESGASHGPFDQVIWAIGRRPNTAELGLGSAGVAIRDGYIEVDAFQVTSVETIFAIGDCTGQMELTPVAIAAGRRLADRLYGGMTDRKLDYNLVPTVVFTHPPIGSVGLSEPAARAEFGDSVRTYEGRFTSMAYALSETRIPSFAKLVVEGEEERVIGLHYIGEGADELLQGFAVAIRMGATKADLDDTVAIHPTSAEELVTLR